ncbi:MAG: peptide transporter [Armatimonadota bacterium]
MAEINDIAKAREALEEVSGDDVQRQEFEDGFTIRTVIGALFVGLIMMPGAMYLGLVAGQGLGPAASWVTVVLFAELARRSFQPLKRQELYMLIYIAGGVVGGAGGVAGMIWNQYLVQCPQIGELAKLIPTWVAPHANDPSLAQRTFLTHAWVIPILLMVFYEVTSRMVSIGGGFCVFKVTSDIERLPFPMAPIAAAGATALAEAGSKEESWRWQVFSTGTVIGLLFGLVYLFIPVVTGVLFPKPVTLIPIPFIDFTSNTERVLPAAWSALSGDITSVIVGFVIPFPIVLGQFISSIACQIGLNPILYHMGMFPDWTYGTPYPQTQLATSIDFWMSVGIGTALGIGVIGLGSVIHSLLKVRREANRPTMNRNIAINRGDWAIKWSLAVWGLAILAQIIVAHFLVPSFPWWIFCFYGLIYTPVISYVSGRLIGLTGQGVGFPYLREATIIKSGYKGADIWFVPMPMHDLGGQAQFFRELELVGVKFNNIIKAEILKLLIVLPASFMFWSFFWKTSPIPSAQYPFVQRMWPINATMGSIWWTANTQNLADNWLFRALRPSVIVGSGIGTLLLFGISSLFKVPILFFYGFMGGIQSAPMNTIPLFTGSCLGRFYFRKRFGDVRWGQYAPVLAAGFGCGTGLTAMTGIAVALITKSVNYLPF